MRRFAPRQGQRHLSGLWWSATAGGHVGFESWLERDLLLALDFDTTVVAIASLPFWLSWSDDTGQAVRHARGLLRAPGGRVRGRGGLPASGTAPAARRREVRRDSEACESLGWEYRLLGAPAPVVTANLRWLAGYRHPRHRLPAAAAALMGVFAAPRSLMVAAEQVDDPVEVLPVLYHLLWWQELVADLCAPLRARTVVRVEDGQR